MYVDGTCHSQKKSTPRTRPGHCRRWKSWDHVHTACALSILGVSSLLMSCICCYELVMFYCIISSGTWTTWTIAARLIWESKPTTSDSWKKLFTLVVWVSRSGRTGSLQESQFPGSFDFTPLSDKDKLRVFKKLPAKMDSLLLEDLAPQVARLWNICDRIWENPAYGIRALLAQCAFLVP